MLRFHFPDRHHRRGLPLREHLGPGHPRAGRGDREGGLRGAGRHQLRRPVASSPSSKAAPAPSSCRSTTRSSRAGPELDPAVLNLRKFIQEIRFKNADIPIYLYGETRTSPAHPERHPARAARLHPHVRGHAGVRGAPHHPRGQELPRRPGAAVLQGADGLRAGRLLLLALPGPLGRRGLPEEPGRARCSTSSSARTCCAPTSATRSRSSASCSTTPARWRQSERNAARIFNADHCFFVTNGTSTSNKMVWHHTVAPGDVVVVDRNCHKSILHSIIMTGAVPVFLTPTRNHYGIIGPIPQSEFAPRGDPRARSPPTRCWPASTPSKVKPRILTLTQSTYDGVLYNTETIKAKLDGWIDTLHFDEAWLPHAAFHPFYGSFHAMGKQPPAARRRRWSTPRRPRTSCWPASARPRRCWCRTRRRSKLDRHLFNEAYLMHTSTSRRSTRSSRQLRRGRGDDGAARRHRAGGGEHQRGAGLPPRDAQGRQGVRQGLVVQGLGPGQAGRRTASASATTGC